MAHKYHLDPDRKVDASAPGLGNHHTLFDFETMSEYYAKAVYVDGTPEVLGETLHPNIELTVDGAVRGTTRAAFVDAMAALRAPLSGAAADYADWRDLHVYVTTCDVTATDAAGARVTFANTLVFGDPPEHKIVAWRVETKTG